MTIKRETVAERKALPIASGVLDYFPDALLAVAEVSRVGNEQHHPGQPLHWDKSKSTDEADALLRHLLDRGTTDTDGLRHSAKVAWRALALLQRELDAEAAAGADPIYADVTVQDIMPVMEGSVFGQSGVAWQAYGDDMLGAQDRSQSKPSIIQAMYADAFRTYETDGGEVFGVPGRIIIDHTDVTNRGEWPPDTRVGGYLTCCGQTEHDLACPQYR